MLPTGKKSNKAADTTGAKTDHVFHEMRPTAHTLVSHDKTKAVTPHISGNCCDVLRTTEETPNKEAETPLRGARLALYADVTGKNDRRSESTNE